MTSIRITIREDDKARDLIRFLRDIDFLDVQVDENADAVNTRGVDALKSLCGIWRDRDITLESLRKKAWAQGERQ